MGAGPQKDSAMMTGLKLSAAPPTLRDYPNGGHAYVVTRPRSGNDGAGEVSGWRRRPPGGRGTLTAWGQSFLHFGPFQTGP